MDKAQVNHHFYDKSLRINISRKYYLITNLYNKDFFLSKLMLEVVILITKIIYQ